MDRLVSDNGWGGDVGSLYGCQTAPGPTQLPPPTQTPAPDVAASARVLAADASPTPSLPAASEQSAPQPVLQEYPVPSGSRPHDAAPAVDGGVWYTAQGSGELGWLDPATGETRHIAWALVQRRIG
jgi:streptogramin lyase